MISKAYVYALIFLTGLFTTLAARADVFTIRLSSTTASFDYTLTTKRSVGEAGEGVGINIGAFYNDDKDLIGVLGFQQDQSVSIHSPLRVSLGLRIYGGRLELTNKTFASLALGGELRIMLPIYLLPVSVYGGIYYSPEITSYIDGEGMRDVTAGVAIHPTRQSQFFAEYRYFDIELTSTNVSARVQDGVALGVRVRF